LGVEVYVLVHDEDFDEYCLPGSISEVPQVGGRLKVKARTMAKATRHDDPMDIPVAAADGGGASGQKHQPRRRGSGMFACCSALCQAGGR
jgi:hypothetical protein